MRGLRSFKWASIVSLLKSGEQVELTGLNLRNNHLLETQEPGPCCKRPAQPFSTLQGMTGPVANFSPLCKGKLHILIREGRY